LKQNVTATTFGQFFTGATLSDTLLDLGNTPMEFYCSRRTKIPDLRKVELKIGGGSYETKDLSLMPSALWIGKQ
jgi:hypothetical protein